MKDTCYKVLDCSNFNEINADLLDYVTKYTNLLTNDPRTGVEFEMPVQYANFPERFGYSIVHFVKANPGLVDWCKSFGLVLRDVYFTLAWVTHTTQHPESSCALHLDRPPVHWKLNWPILNMNGTAVRFYKAKDPAVDIASLVTKTGIIGSKDREGWSLEYKDFVEIDKHIFNNTPIIMNGQLPHDVGFLNVNQIFPRIGVQGMFVREPDYLL